jgi:hypothetical protein
MRDRWFRMVVTIATSATIACGDEAVDSVTAPKPAAMPVVPATNQWPYTWEFSGQPSAVSLQISSDAHFTADNLSFEATARVSFTWSNDVSAKLDVSLLNKDGQTINRSSAGMSYHRFALPVASGDSTLVVRISTNNITCGLVGKHSYEGRASQIAIDAKLIQITLFTQGIQTTNGADVQQPACPPPPGCEQDPVNRVVSGATGILASATNCDYSPLPPGAGSEEFQVCFAVWRELWVWNYYLRSHTLVATWLVGMFCYITTMET